MPAKIEKPSKKKASLQLAKKTKHSIDSGMLTLSSDKKKDFKKMKKQRRRAGL